ncbi:MAG: 30S ribosomal protein S5 [Terricaulis silvestris]
MTDETAGGGQGGVEAPAEQPRGPRGPRGPRRGGPGGGGGRGRGPGGGDRDRREGRGPRAGSEDERDSEFVDKLVAINRVAKVVKGGKNFGFAALVVVGDKKGRVGFGHGKAREVPEAIRKATEEAKKSLIRVPLREGRTLHHDGRGQWGAGKVMLRAAPPGTGLIAGGPMRAVLEVLGVSDVVAKSQGSSNPYNMVRATFDMLKQQTSPRHVANRRGLKVSDLVQRRKDGASLGDVPAEG